MSESQSKLQNKAQNKANKIAHKNKQLAEAAEAADGGNNKKRNKSKAKGKGKDAAPGTEEAPFNPLKNFALLSQHITDKRSVMALDALAQMDFKSKVQLISEISQYVIMSPENNMMHVQTLLHLSEDDNIIIAKMALISAAEVFKDVAPLYEINDEKVKTELKKQISKDDRKLLMFELTFFDCYKRYVTMLSDFVHLKPKKYISSLGTAELTAQEKEKYEGVCREYGRVALLCLADLISSLYHLNFKKDIIALVTSKLKSFDEETRKIAKRVVNQFLSDQNPSTFEIKVTIVHTISKTFGSTGEPKLPDDFLDPLNNLTLQYNLVPQEDEDESQIGQNNSFHKKRKAKELKDKKAKEASAKLNDRKLAKLRAEKMLKKEMKNELKEAEATISAKKVENFKHEILTKVFYIYFKILKYPKPSKFFGVAMNGILKFLHLIGTEILEDLIHNLGACGDRLREHHMKHMEESKTMLHYRITCIFAEIEIINQLGKLVELDDKEAINTLYQLFVDICKFPKLTKSLDLKDQEMIVKTISKVLVQKRQLSLETVASFVKIFLECCQKLAQEDILLVKCLVFLVKQLIHKYTVLSRLFEEENEGYGLDMYNATIEDPQATNALRTYIVNDLKKLQKKYPKDPEVQILLKKTENQERLPTHLASLTPVEFFRRYSV